MPDGRVIEELESTAQVTDLHEIGRGAAATVYRGRQAQFDRSVAVKILEQPLVEGKSLRRFARECQALGRVSQHPNIVTVHSSGTTASGHAYLVMEYCGGGSLAARLPGDPTPTEQTLQLGVQLASALEWAHQARMIHRDIKPANVLLSSLGEPVLADFGIAAVEIGEMSLTVHDSLTPLHAAPEVIVHGGGDARSDVWSLASTLYTLAAGRAPFAADIASDTLKSDTLMSDTLMSDTLMSLMTRITQAPLPPLAAGDSGPLFAAIARAMHKDPAQRTPGAAAFGADLQRAQQAAGWPVTTFLSAGAPEAPPAVPGGPAPPADAAATPAPADSAASRPPGDAGETRPPAGRPRRTPLLIGGGAVVGLALLVGGIVLASGSGHRAAGREGAAAASPTPTRPAGTSPAPSASASAADLPRVTANATDLGREPVIGAGTLPGPATLQTRDLIEGAGLAVTPANRVVIREVTAVYGSGKVLAGWKDAPNDATLPVHDFSRSLDLPDSEDAGIVGMKPGGRREIVVPSPDLGGTDETFVVDLVTITA